MKITVNSFIKTYAPCQEGADFALAFRTMREVWDALANGQCQPEWLVWLASCDGIIDRKVLVRATVHAVRKTVGHLLKDPRSTRALDVAESWTNGKASLDNVRQAADAAAYAAYDAAYAAYAAYDAATYAARAAYYAADAAARAANAAANVANTTAAYETFREIFAEEIPNPFEE